MKKCWKKLVAFESILYKFIGLLKSYINLFFAIVGLIVLSRLGTPRTFYGLSPDKIIDFRFLMILMVMMFGVMTGIFKMHEKGFFDLKWLLVQSILISLVAVGIFYSLSYLVQPTIQSGLCLSLVLFELSVDLIYLYPRYLYFIWWKPFIRRIENGK